MGPGCGCTSDDPTTPRAPEVERSGRQHPLLVALEWDRQLREGSFANRAAIARAHGLTRARITQILNLLRLPEPVRAGLLGRLAMRRPVPSERALRPLLHASPGGAHEQVDRLMDNILAGSCGFGLE